MMSTKMKNVMFVILVWIAERFNDAAEFLLDKAEPLMPEADGVEFIEKEVR